MRLAFAAGTTAYLRTLAQAPRKAIRDALRLIEKDPRHKRLDLKQLRKRGDLRSYRARVGDYRIIYSPRPGHACIWRVMHRSEGYGWLERLDPPE